jgi:hypothetical protein
MELLKLAIDWAKTEIFSSTFFVVFGILFLLASLGFWQFDKTDLAKAYIIPSLVAAVLLLIIGSGLIYSNLSRVNSFPKDYKQDAVSFAESEIDRTEKTLKGYKNVFIIIPLIIAICALLMIFFDSAVWRASLITTIAMMSVILLIDGNAGSRIEAYPEQLLLIKEK